jgi:cytochrome c biogenesis protein
MVTETEKSSFERTVDTVWNLFSSIKLAVIIFAVISLTSIVGTIIEQNAEPEKNILILSKFVGGSAAPSLYTILDKLQFTSMYDSWWFIILLLLFAANLIICSIDRLPRILKLVRESIRPVSLERLEKLSIRKTTSMAGKGHQSKEHIISALQKIGFSPSEHTDSSGIQLYAEKGNFTRLGVYITHFSILVILAGSIIGIYFGFNAYLPLNEGETSSVAYQGGSPVPLGFEIRCDNFEVDFYDSSDRPKDFKSWLTVIKDGKEVKKQSIEVNDPLSYGGITFYQSSYGTSNDVNRGIFVFRVSAKNGAPAEINPRIGDTFTIPGTSLSGKILRFNPALSLDKNGRPFQYSQQMTNPAVYIEFTEEGKNKYSGWLLKRYPKTWSLPDGNRVEFLEYWGVQYTGLQVRKDPGVFLVYLGCLIMSAGLYITFFMSHRKIWIHLVPARNNTDIVIGALANKNRASLERKIEKLLHILTADHKGGK